MAIGRNGRAEDARFTRIWERFAVEFIFRREAAFVKLGWCSTKLTGCSLGEPDHARWYGPRPSAGHQ